MCGIVGIVHSDPARPVPPAVIRRMCEAIRHRGPDDEGAYVDRNVGLGMRRLSIIDLAGGRQPIFNEDQSKVIVFNGEIYNYRELRRGLIAQGHGFATQGDTEVILHLYEQYGPECVQRLRGMFAFAIWDSAEQTLFLARDRFGIKPLYVTSGPWGIGFASELKALHVVGLTHRELDWDALDTYFQLGYIPAPATPFRAIRKLEPGHTAVWNHAGGLSTRQYWDLPRDRTPTPRDVEAQIADWLDESVQAHLVSDVPVAGERCPPPRVHREVLRLRCRKCRRNGSRPAARRRIRRDTDGGGHSPRRPGPARADHVRPGRAPRRRIRRAHVAPVAGGRRVLQGRPHRDRRRRVVCRIPTPHRVPRRRALRALAPRGAARRERPRKRATGAPGCLPRRRSAQAIPPGRQRVRARTVPQLPDALPQPWPARAVRTRAAPPGERRGGQRLVPRPVSASRCPCRPFGSAVPGLQDVPR